MWSSTSSSTEACGTTRSPVTGEQLDLQTTDPKPLSSAVKPVFHLSYSLPNQFLISIATKTLLNAKVQGSNLAIHFPHFPHDLKLPSPHGCAARFMTDLHTLHQVLFTHEQQIQQTTFFDCWGQHLHQKTSSTPSTNLWLLVPHHVTHPADVDRQEFLTRNSVFNKAPHQFSEGGFIPFPSLIRQSTVDAHRDAFMLDPLLIMPSKPGSANSSHYLVWSTSLSSILPASTSKRICIHPLQDTICVSYLTPHFWDPKKVLWQYSDFFFFLFASYALRVSRQVLEMGHQGKSETLTYNPTI